VQLFARPHANTGLVSITVSQANPASRAVGSFSSRLGYYRLVPANVSGRFRDSVKDMPGQRVSGAQSTPAGSSPSRLLPRGC